MNILIEKNTQKHRNIFLSEWLNMKESKRDVPKCAAKLKDKHREQSAIDSDSFSIYEAGTG